MTDTGPEIDRCDRNRELFGDILTDEARCWPVRWGCCLRPVGGDSERNEAISGLYEPIHGSAPTIAGQNIANPIATIMTVAMMLRYSLALSNEAKIIEDVSLTC